MKKIKRYLAALMIVCTLISISATNVSALTAGTTYSFNTKYTSVYYNFGSYQTANGEYHSGKGQLALRTLKSTGEPIYCLQAHKAANNDAVKATELKNTAAWEKELDKTARDGIKRVSIFGFPNYDYGYSAETAQIATQMLIWEWQTNNRRSWSSSASSKVTNAISGNALKCYNKILEACRNRDDKPSFSPSSVKLKGTGESNAVTVTDSTNRLSDFEVTSTPDGAKASISGNKLKIWATKSPVKGTIQLTKKFTNKGSAMGLTGAGQTMFYGSVSDPVRTNITIDLSTGSLSIVKTSEDGKVDGFTFRITGTNYNKTAKTDTNGKISVSGLQAGTYTVEEINLPPKYVQPKPQTVKVEAGKTATVNFKNTLLDGECSVIKTNEANEPLAGVEFTLYTDKACTKIATLKGSATKCVKTTDSTGKIEFKPLAQGTYYLKETALPTDLAGSYEMSDKVYTVDLTNGGQKTVSAINYMNTNLAMLIKECEGGGYIDKEGTLANVEGVLSKEFTFIFTRDDGKEVTARSWYDTGIIDSFESSGGKHYDNEICSASDPNVDDYYFVEGRTYKVTERLSYKRQAISQKETPDGSGYVSSDEAAKFYAATGADDSNNAIVTHKSFTVPTGTIAKGEPFVVTFKNNYIRGNVNVVKTSDDNLLEGFEFYIHGTTVTGEEYSDIAKTDEDGKIGFTNLLAGTYTIEEINRPLRYADSADNEPQTVTISKDGETKEVNFDNPLRYGKLDIIKAAEDGIISNVKFKVTSDAGYSKAVTTGSTGKARVTKLPIYDSNDNLIVYKVEEVDTPIRYYAVDAQEVILEEDSASTVKFENKLKYSVAVIRKKCEDGKIEGVKFTVYGEDGSKNELVTDENGECSIELPIYDSNNNIISYRIHEDDTPNWYLPVADKTITLTLDEPTYADIVNTPKKGNVKVVKSSEDGVIEGLKFRLYGTSDSGEKVDETRTTDSHGIALFDNILVGTYTLEEADTPVRYITPTAQKVIVTENGKTYYYTMYNPLVSGNLVLHKVNTETGEALSGAEFTVYKDADKDGKYNKDVDTVAGIMTETDTAGEYLLKELKYGKYLVKETKAPEGFYLDETYYPFEITKNGEIKTVETAGNGFGNEPIKGTVRLIKADRENRDIMLSGAEFTVYKDINEDGKYTEGVDTVVGIMTETENGCYEMTGLKHGKYLVKETKAPEGYLEDPSYYVFEVDGTDDYTAGTSSESQSAAPNADEIAVAAIFDIKKNFGLSKIYKTNEWSD